MLSWIVLYLAIAFEITGTVLLKQSKGMSSLVATVASLGAYAVSLACLGFALKHLEVGIAYAIWSGLGTLAVAVIGMAFFGEVASPSKLFCLALVVAGVVGLNLSGARTH
jgi:small multidrug resistance pump